MSVMAAAGIALKVWEKIDEIEHQKILNEIARREFVIDTVVKLLAGLPEIRIENIKESIIMAKTIAEMLERDDTAPWKVGSRSLIRKKLSEDAVGLLRKIFD